MDTGFDLVNSSVYARNHPANNLAGGICLDPGPRFQQLKQLLSSLLRTLLLLVLQPVFLPPLQQDLGAWSPGDTFCDADSKLTT